MSDNPHPLWRQERCEWCRAGVVLYRGSHPIPKDPQAVTMWEDSDWHPCTAPTEAEYIVALTARIAELENDRAELRTAAIRFINEAPREGDLAIMMLVLSGTAKPEHRPMIDAYSAARRELYGLLTAGTLP